MLNFSKDIFPSGFEFLEPWHFIDFNYENSFENELHKEISSEHILFGLKVKAIARRYDCDDVLFTIIDNCETYAKVHLTWSGRKESNAKWPTTIIYKNMTKWKPGVKPPRDVCPQKFCFHWRAKGTSFASGLYDNLHEALNDLRVMGKDQCMCSFGKCIRDKSQPGNKDWYEACEPLLKKYGLPWFYFICNSEDLPTEDRNDYQEYFSNL